MPKIIQTPTPSPSHHHLWPPLPELGLEALLWLGPPFGIIPHPSRSPLMIAIAPVHHHSSLTKLRQPWAPPGRGCSIPFPSCRRHLASAREAIPRSKATIFGQRWHPRAPSPSSELPTATLHICKPRPPRLLLLAPPPPRVTRAAPLRPKATHCRRPEEPPPPPVSHGLAIPDLLRANSGWPSTTAVAAAAAGYLVRQPAALAYCRCTHRCATAGHDLAFSSIGNYV